MSPNAKSPPRLIFSLEEIVRLAVEAGADVEIESPQVENIDITCHGDASPVFMPGMIIPGKIVLTIPIAGATGGAGITVETADEIRAAVLARKRRRNMKVNANGNDRYFDLEGE